MNESLKLKQLEIGRTVGRHLPTDNVFRIRIPRLMVKINHEKERIRFNTHIFVNDTKCKVHPVSNLTTQNYITVPKSVNCNLSHIATEIINDVAYIPENTPVTIACFYDNNKMIIIDSY
jgi:hypothetical protein